MFRAPPGLPDGLGTSLQDFPTPLGLIPWAISSPLVSIPLTTATQGRSMEFS